MAQDITPAVIKWADLVTTGTPLPTQTSPDCSKCLNTGSGYPAETVGAFVGAGLYHCGLYRPEETCIMRYADHLGAVCSGGIADTISDYQPECLAPVFAAASGFWWCLAWRVMMLLGAIPLALVSFHPWASCALKRLIFRLQHCETGNVDPCVDLGRAGVAPVVVAEPYESVPSDF